MLGSAVSPLTMLQIRALLEAVEAEAPPSTLAPRSADALNKVPWKKVAQWMVDHRGCYKYGNATVKKKYVELINEERNGGSTLAEYGI